MAKQTFTTGQVLTAAQMTSLQQTAMGGGSPTTKTASYVLVAADAGTVIQMNAAGSTTITVNTALFSAGDSVQIQNIGAGVCTITAGTATVNTAGSLALSQWEGGFLYFTSASSAIFFDVVQSSGMTNPMTTAGDTIYGGASGTPTRLAIGSTGQVLTVSGGNPVWASASSGALTLVSATSFSGVTSHSVNNCFTSTYLNYKILINYTSATGSGVSATMKFRASGTDTSVNYKTCRISGNTSGSGVSADTDAAGTDEILIGLIESGNDNRSFVDMTVYNPQASVRTAAEILSMGINSGNFVNMTIIGAQTDTTAFDGLTILASTGNMTGTIKIYGLQNS